MSRTLHLPCTPVCQPQRCALPLVHNTISGTSSTRWIAINAHSHLLFAPFPSLSFVSLPPHFEPVHNTNLVLSRRARAYVEQEGRNYRDSKVRIALAAARQQISRSLHIPCILWNIHSPKLFTPRSDPGLLDTGLYTISVRFKYRGLSGIVLPNQGYAKVMWTRSFL